MCYVCKGVPSALAADFRVHGVYSSTGVPVTVSSAILTFLLPELALVHMHSIIFIYLFLLATKFSLIYWQLSILCHVTGAWGQ